MVRASDIASSAMLRLANTAVYQWKRSNWIFYARRFAGQYGNVVIDRPIFFVGNQGAGLTLVSRMVRRHPQIVSITGNNRYWAGADEMQSVMNCRLPRSLRLGGRLLCRDVTHGQFKPPRSWSYASDDLIGYYRKTERDYSDQAAHRLRFIIREALHRHGRGRTEKRFVDKSQVFTVKMRYVDALLKDTSPHFVLVTRNPYASCFRAAIGKAGDMRRYAKYLDLDTRVRVCAQHWSNAMGCALEDMDKVSSFKAMRFEDFLVRPKQCLFELCSFLGLAFEEDMVPQVGQHIPLGSKYRDRWYPLRPDVNRQYLEEIPAKYVDVIAERCGAVACRLGYQESSHVE